MISAAILGYADMCRLLLEWGADVAARDEHGETALHKCSHRVHEQSEAIIQMLAAAGAPPIEDDDLFGPEQRHESAQRG